MPSIEGGGVEKNLFIITNFLSKKIDNVCLITASPEFKKKFKNIKIIYPNFDLSKSGRIMKYFFCLFELIKQILITKKILIFSFQANVYCILISKFFRKKIIVRSNSSPSGWSKNFIKKKLFKFILGLADTIIVNSYDFKKEIKKKFNLNSVMIYNPLNKKEIILQSKQKIKFSFFGNSNRILKIINIGRFTEQKDQITLLKSMNEIKNFIPIKLLIMGKGINEYKLKNYVKKKNLGKIVKIIHFKKNPFPYLKKSDLFVLTSIFEGLPNVLLEAATLKKFIISTNCPTGPREILKNGTLGVLTKTRDYKNIAKAIIYFYKNKKKFKSMITSSFKSLERFDLNSNLNKYFIEIKKLT